MPVIDTSGMCLVHELDARGKPTGRRFRDHGHAAAYWLRERNEGRAQAVSLDTMRTRSNARVLTVTISVTTPVDNGRRVEAEGKQHMNSRYAYVTTGFMKRHFNATYDRTNRRWEVY